MNLEIEIIVNGEPRTIASGISLQAALEQWGHNPKLIGVAINEEFVHKQEYETRELVAGDRIEVVAPFAGG